MVTNFINGQGGKVTVGSTDLNVKTWRVNPSAKLHDVTHSGSGGYDEVIPGTKGLTGTVEADWDTNAIPTGAAAPAIKPGAQIALKLYCGDPTYNKYVDVPKAFVSSVPLVNESRGIVSYSFEFTASGTYTLPS